MASYEVPKPPLGFFQRVRESVRLATAFLKGDKSTIADITSETVFSPLQPLQPYLPNIVGRTWDYPVGINPQFGRMDNCALSISIPVLSFHPRTEKNWSRHISARIAEIDRFRIPAVAGLQLRTRPMVCGLPRSRRIQGAKRPYTN